MREGDRCLGAVEVPVDRKGADDLLSPTQRIAARLETAMSRYPDQWFVLERI